MFRNIRIAVFLFVFFLCYCSAGAAFPLATKQIIFQTQGAAIPIQVELARTLGEQARGLMFRENLPADHGMLFIYQQDALHSFWMKNTRISLDIIFIDAQRRIVFIAQHTTPFSEEPITSPRPCRFVLEVNAGFVEKNQIKAGDFVSQIENDAAIKTMSDHPVENIEKNKHKQTFTWHHNCMYFKTV